MTPLSCAAEQIMHARIICCPHHIVQSQDTVGESALEDAHLPQPALQLSSGQAMQVWCVQVKGACSLRKHKLALKLKGMRSSIAITLEGGKVGA